jgi:tRNA threonylcarbamoyladenosine biosynthesis protein TsaB
MITLSIELSTDSGSLALLDGENVLLERMWTENRLQRQQVFAVVEQCVAEGLIHLCQTDLLAVGVGPGAFSGLRMASSLAHALAMPGRKPVVGVASAEALAWATMLTSQCDSVCVWGDARCGEVWNGVFHRGAEWPRRDGHWRVTDRAAEQDEGSLWVTADWDKIGERLKEWRTGGTTLIEGRQVPTARMVGLLAAAKHRAGVAPEPSIPIYVHPAVAIAPMF